MFIQQWYVLELTNINLLTELIKYKRGAGNFNNHRFTKTLDRNGHVVLLFWNIMTTNNNGTNGNRFGLEFETISISKTNGGELIK